MTLPRAGTRLHAMGRTIRAGAYAASAAAGVAALAIGPPPSEHPAWRATVTAWALFLVVGGLTCLGGYLARVWPVEKIGLPLVGSAYLLYATVLLWPSDSSNVGRAAVGFTCLAAGCEFYARVIQVTHEQMVWQDTQVGGEGQE